MKWQIVVVGNPSLRYAKSGMDEYLKRLQRYTNAEVVVIKESDLDPSGARFGNIVANALTIVLDERGERWTTAHFREAVDSWELDGSVKCVALFIGGADGHTSIMRHRADLVLSLSSFTMQHELALVVFLEQLYRVYTWKRGEPYHR